MGHDAKSCVSEVFKMGQKPVWPEHWFLSKWRSKGSPSRLKSKIASGYSFRRFRQLGFSPTDFKLEQIAPNTDSENLITKNNCTQSFEKLPKSLNFAQSVHTGGTHMGEEKPRLSVFRKVIIASVRATACLLSRLFWPEQKQLEQELPRGDLQRIGPVSLGTPKLIQVGGGWGQHRTEVAYLLLT